MSNVTTFESVRESLGSGAGSSTDSVLRAAYNAAEGYVADRCRWPESESGTVVAPPAALVQAVQLLTARYLVRRNSATGVLGVGDLGEVRIPGMDADVKQLIAPYRKRPLG